MVMLKLHTSSITGSTVEPPIIRAATIARAVLCLSLKASNGFHGEGRLLSGTIKPRLYGAKNTHSAALCVNSATR